MSVYMVERDLKGITMEQLGAAQQRAIETSNRFADTGKQVRYIRTTFVPGEERWKALPRPAQVRDQPARARSSRRWSTKTGHEPALSLPSQMKRAALGIQKAEEANLSSDAMESGKTPNWVVAAAANVDSGLILVTNGWSGVEPDIFANQRRYHMA